MHVSGSRSSLISSQFLPRSAIKVLSLVNRDTYKIVLPIWYSRIVIKSYASAKSFIHDPLHQAHGTLAHVRYLSLNCRNEPEDLVSDVCLLVAEKFSKDQLQGLIWELPDKFQLPQGALTKILQLQPRIETLYLQANNWSLEDLRGVGDLRHLRHLKVTTSHERRQLHLQMDSLGDLLERLAPQLSTLDIGRYDRASCARPYPIQTDHWKQLFGNFVVHHLEMLTIRHCDFQRIELTLWDNLHLRTLKALHFKRCFHLGPILDRFHFNTSTPWSLTSLEVSLWNMRLEENPMQVARLEHLLLETGLKLLEHLHIDIPAAVRLPNVTAVAAQRNLKSLAVVATDDDGWWLTYSASDLGIITQCCQQLQLICLTLPGLDAVEFYVYFLLIPV